VRVQVPATSANLGPGFDALGLALSIVDEVTARVVPDGLAVEIAGEGAADVARDETHLLVRAMLRTFTELAADRPGGLAIQCVNRIPHSRGLGSSAAAIVAGILLARGLVSDGAQRLPDPAVLTLAADLEGHPDNVAPCLLGGLTVAWREGAEAHAVRCELHPDVVPVALVPPFGASTELARGLLPDTVPHRDAAFSAGRAALLVAALTTEPEQLFAATEDRLHQHYRADAMPTSTALLAQLRAAGQPAVISGAGPTVLVLARGDVEAESAVALAPDGWAAHRLTVGAGARLLPIDTEA
jgi:homoserine kinase